MHKWLFSLLCLITVINSSAQQKAQVTLGKIVHMESFSSKYIPSRNVDVWLPDGYTTSKKYAVLYMHDGQMLFDSAITWNKQEWHVDETVSALLKESKIQDCIVVGVWNTKDRLGEYYPQQPLKYLPDSVKQSLKQNFFKGDPQADNYLLFLTKELKPFIDKNYTTYRDRAHTFIAGSSMGGLISLYAICEYPKVFGGAACMSTHWPGIVSTQSDLIPKSYYSYLSKKLPSPKSHKIYFDYGTETLDSLYKKYQLKVDEIAKQKGYTASNTMSKEFEGHNHSEKSWSARLHVPLLFLLGK